MRRSTVLSLRSLACLLACPLGVLAQSAQPAAPAEPPAKSTPAPPTPAVPDLPPGTPPRWSHPDGALGKTLAFNAARLAMMDVIAREHPEYAARCKAAREAWTTAFGPAAEALTLELVSRGPKQKASLDKALAALTAMQAQSKGPSEADLAAKFDTMFASSAQPQDQIAMLLAFTPKYDEKPEAELDDGYARVERIPVQGDDNAAIQIIIPISWQETPGGKKHAQLRTFLFCNGVGPAEVKVSARTRGERSAPWTQSQAQEASDKFQPPSPDLVVLEHGILQLPGGGFAATQLYKVAYPDPRGAAAQVLNRYVQFPLGNVMVTFTGAVTTLTTEGKPTPDDAAMAAVLKRYEPTFDRVLFSIQGGERPITPAAPPAPPVPPIAPEPSSK